MRAGAAAAPVPVRARRWVLEGRVQGVGFRPFVHRLAARHGLAGWVQNRLGRVVVHAEGPPAALARFGEALVREAPPLACPRIAESAEVPPRGMAGFRILASASDGEARVHLPPDRSVCEACLCELEDPRDRRHRYPFVNCTQCGPRYTIIESLPYDRARTSMARFALCADCAREYADPGDRRFHAEPLACPRCGPRLRWRGAGGAAEGEGALAAALECLRGGGIVAVRGVGGYHLLCDARSDAAVARLRARKRRPAKPLAVLFPDLAVVRRVARLDAAAAEALADPARPIVLVPLRQDAGLAAGIAPGLGEVGALLPYSPLHHLLARGFGAPLVATSGNVSGDPVVTDPDEAEALLGAVADGFLHHDRPIVRPADDPVLRPIAGAPRPLRLGRGTAPLELELPRALPEPVLATGGHMKATIALAWERRAVVSPHVGDLEAPRARALFERLAADLQRLYGVRARRLLHDAHPDYFTTRWARAAGLPARAVQHHRAHASALAAEHPDVERWLVLAWDGVGYGDDGTLWGGEAFLGRPGAWRRVASLRPFRLPGGARAAREPWRSALGVLWEAGLERPVPGAPADVGLLRAAWARGRNAPLTSAAGRLFDAAAALTGLCAAASYEGEGPMRLEAAAARAAGTPAEPPALAWRPGRDGILRLDWAPLLPALADGGRAPEARAAAFHEALARAVAALAARMAREAPGLTVGLCGGVFQNRLLAERCLALLAGRGIGVRLPLRVPGNDGGLAFGQVAEALHAWTA